MKKFLLLFLFFVFQTNYSMEPEPGINDIKIELLGDTESPDLSDKDWINLITASWLGNIEEENESNEHITDQFDKILTDKKVNDVLSYFIRKGKNPNENNFAHQLIKRIDITSKHQLKLFEYLVMYGTDLHKENIEGDTLYQTALKRKLNIKSNWIVTENQFWEENHDYLPPFVTNRYRCFPEYEKNGKITLCIVQGKGFFDNFENYYDFKNDKSHGFFQFAQEYIDQYNQNFEENRKKAMHLLVFKLHRSPAKNLTAFLNSWHYKDDDYIFAALGDTCNRVNDALRILAILQKNKLYQKNHGKGPNEIYEGIAKLLIYFYPSCQQKYANNKNYKSWNPLNYNPFNPLFDYVNNEFMPNEPTSYNQLLIFYSKDDLITKGKAIDLYSLATGATLNAFAYLASHYISKNLINKKKVEELLEPLNETFSIPQVKKIIESIKSLKPEQLQDLGLMITAETLPKLTFGASIQALHKKIIHSHTYLDIIQKNNAYENENGDRENIWYEVRGPKSHVEILEDGKTMGHQSILLLKYFPLLWKILKDEYPGHFACSSNFIANINTEATHQDDLIQCFLEEYKSDYDNSGYIGCDPRNIELVGAENPYLMKIARQKNIHRIDLLDEESNNNHSPHQRYKEIFDNLYPQTKKWSQCNIL